ncbi:hypothetical protein BBA71_14010 [Acetobacter pasteurianus]|nr:hypothetical protein BBA71_14010 [Acetobacter pasteurianus]
MPEIQFQRPLRLWVALCFFGYFAFGFTSLYAAFQHIVCKFAHFFLGCQLGLLRALLEKADDAEISMDETSTLTRE